MPFVETPILRIQYEHHGDPQGWPVVLSHGFPYSPAAYDEVVPLLVAAGARVIVPFLRGFGGTRFLSSAAATSSSSSSRPSAARTGQQAALALDLAQLLEALELEGVVLAGFDWGGLASCTATALFPARVAGLVCYGGYDIIDVKANRSSPVSPSLERVLWYQHLFQTERGKFCLQDHRAEIARMLWEEWSPGWRIPEEKFSLAVDAIAGNPDFVDVVTSHCRHAFGNLPVTDEQDQGEDGDDGQYAELERRLAAKPSITVPAVTVDGTRDPLKPGGTAESCRGRFTGRHHEHWTLDIGHAFPMEAPQEFARAVLKVREWTLESFTER